MPIYFRINLETIERQNNLIPLNRHCQRVTDEQSPQRAPDAIVISFCIH